MLRVLILCCVLPILPARACDTALVLTIDVSNSIDAAEYRLQVDGLADALADPEVAQALVEGHVALAVVQWSGTERQALSIPWTRMTSAAAVAEFAAEARIMPRAFIQSDTAPAEAIRYALTLFDAVPDCARRVIDISGDGTANAGSPVPEARRAAQRAGVTINAIAIEGMGLAITGFYSRQVITSDGFVVTARTYRDYPRAIRDKILREVARIFG
ncbi:MAG: Ca-activated chloride channel-like protein [Rhodobacteraceae bacterium HLUCCA08]|nr:MAG: Ca-activated chloride channel-like protein [Rhodobacteraceae bacterium HLUCCA08]